jgi:hypothetical protein
MADDFHGFIENTDVLHSPGYHSWQDGVTYNEISPDTIQQLSETFMNAFGEYGIEVFDENGIFNASMSLGGDGVLTYDPNLLWSVGENFGADAISGVLAHEVGHHMVEQVFGDHALEITSWQHELCADYIAGIVTQLGGMSPEAMHKFYSDFNISPINDMEHPAGGLRSEAFDAGIEWAENNHNAIFSEFLLKDKSVLMDMFETDVLNHFPGSLEEYLG